MSSPSTIAIQRAAVTSTTGAGRTHSMARTGRRRKADSQGDGSTERREEGRDRNTGIGCVEEREEQTAGIGREGRKGS
eukprot:2944571-Rhodomonas_salina.1